MLPETPSLGTRRARALAALGLAAATFLLFLQVRGFGFLQFDDPLYVTENRAVLRGLSAEGLRWALGTLEVANWQPLAWLSHMLDVELFGADPGAHHLVSAGWHAAAAAALFLALAALTGAPRRSLLAAVLWAVHPLHVESVAWVSERKDLLSTCFGFVALGLYARHAARPSAARLAAVALALALSLSAKAMWMTAPFLLLVLDAWPLRRLGREPLRRLLLEKVPLLALSAAAAGVALVAQRRAGALVDAGTLGLGDRLANAVLSYAAYLRLALWPAGLSAFYPRPATDPGALLAAGAALAAVSAAAIATRRRAPWLAAGWCWFLGMLVPVIGLVQAGEQAMADRYAYAPSAGLCLAAAFGAGRLATWAGARGAAARAAVGAAGIAAVVALSAATFAQTARWRDQATLFSHALEVVPPSGRVHHLLSQGLEAQGRTGEALLHAREAARLDPANPRAHKNLGYLLYRLGLLDEAIAALERAVTLDPGYAEAHGNLGIAYGKAGRLEEAVRHMRLEAALRSGARPP